MIKSRIMPDQEVVTVTETDLSEVVDIEVEEEIERIENLEAVEEEPEVASEYKSS